MIKNFNELMWFIGVFFILCYFSSGSDTMAKKDLREEIVKEYYNTYKEDERFLAQHRKVEFIK